MVPEGWVRQNLDQVADVRTGVAKGKTGLKNPVSLPYLRVANVQDGYLDLTEMKEIEVEATQVERYSLRSGDIVLTEGGDFDKLGRGTIWRGQVSNCLHQNHVFAVRVTSPHLMPEFFAMQAGSKYGRDYFLSCAKRSTNLASINSTQLKQFPVLLPPLHEQQKIAEILGTWDKAIETTEALLANARTQKRALMQSLLTGTRRFPGFEDHPWREVRLGDVLEIAYGKSPKEIFVDGGGFPVIGTGGETGRTNTALADGPAIIIGRKGTIDSPQWVEGGFWCIDTTYYCYAKDGNDLRWLFAWLGSINLKDYNEASGVPSLSRETLRLITLQLPSVPEQHLIAKVMLDIDTNITTIMAQLNHLRTEKKSLMQQLLTGKRRVVV